MDRKEYDLIQQALSDHLQRASVDLPMNKHERDLYRKAVLACKSVVSKTATQCVNEFIDLKEELAQSKANSNLWKISCDLTKEELILTTKERDALINYMQNSTYLFCDICKHNTDGSGAGGCKRVRKIRNCFEWIGLPEERKDESEHE